MDAPGATIEHRLKTAHRLPLLQELPPPGGVAAMREGATGAAGVGKQHEQEQARQSRLPLGWSP